MTARILLIEDPTDPQRAEVAAHDGPFVDWLQVRFPEGFGGRSRAVFRAGGLVEVALDDWDFAPDPGEVVVVVVAPGAPAAILAGIALNIAISLAISVLSSVLFPPPEQPAFERAARADPVFSLSSPQNQGRRHEPLPVLYGRLTYSLDLAAQPYSFYADNEQFVVSLLVVTCGECEVDEVFAGETLVDDLPDGAVRWRVYGPADHGSVHGRIGDDFGIWEDVSTSPDVASLDLRSATRAQKLRIPAEFMAPDTIRLFGVGDTVEPFEVGASIIVTGSDANNATVTIDAINPAAAHTDLDVGGGVTDEAATSSLLRAFDDDAIGSALGRLQVWKISEDPAGGALDLDAGDVVKITADDGLEQLGIVAEYRYAIDYEAGETDVVAGRHVLKLQGVASIERAIATGFSVYQLTDAPTFDVSGIPRWTGPFRVTKAGQSINKIEVDLVFPGGLYETDPESGEMQAASAEFLFQVQEIDSAGDPVGSWVDHDLTIGTGDVLVEGEPLNTPVRLTETFFTGAGEWRIRARRTSPESAEAADQSRCIWEALKGRRILRSSPVYGPVTLLAVEFKASAGLSREAIGRVRATAHRRLPQIRDPFDREAVGLSRSPVRAAYDVLCNPDYGLGLDPAAYLDLADMRAARSRHSDAGLRFDHVFADEQSVWEAVRLALQPALAEPGIYGGRVTIRQEGPKEVRTLLFSPINVALGSLRIAYSFRAAGDPDGVRVVSRDPGSLAQRESLWPPSAVRPTEERVYGLTDAAVALDLAKVRWRQRKGARILATFEVEGEGRIVRRGERVGLSWPTFGWGDAARVVEVDGLDLVLDRPVPEIDGGIRWAALRDDDGSSVGPVAMTKAGPRRITLAADPGIAVRAIGGDREPTHVAIGKGADFLLDLIVEDVAVGDGGRARVTAKGYLAEAWAGTVFEGVVT